MEKIQDLREHRKHLRYNIKLKVHCLGKKTLGYTRNISMDGCCIETPFEMKEGFIENFIIDLPNFGEIPFKGYVQYAFKTSNSQKTVAGIEFLKERFNREQQAFFNKLVEFIRSITLQDRP